MNKMKSFLLAGCTVLMTMGLAGSAFASYEASVSTPNTENGIIGKWLAWFAEEVHERTDGEVTINPFYNNSLGDQKDMFTQLSNGEIEMILDGTVSLDYYAPEYGFLTAPYIVKDTDHLDALMHSEIFDGLEAKLEENNITMLATGLRASRELLTSDKIRFEGLDNINGLIIRLPDLETYVSAWQELGASTQILGGGEIYSSLQTGVINACEGPYDQFLELKLEEIGSYVYNTNHVTEFYALYAGQKWIESLPEELRTVVVETAQEALNSAREETLENVEANLQKLVDAGLEYVETDTTAMAEKLAPMWEKKFETDWTVTDYETVMSYAD